jgi:hypothetical protein
VEKRDESRMTARILLPTALFLSVLSPDVLRFKTRRRSLPGYPTWSMEAPQLFLQLAQTGS